MPEAVTSGFMQAGAVGAIALAALFALVYVYKAAERERERHELVRKELVQQIIDAHKLRADDARGALGTSTEAMGKMARAGEEQAAALASVRDALRDIR